MVWALLYTVFACFVHIISWWAILFTGRQPRILWDLLEAYFRFTANIHAYLLCLTDAYPPFSGGADTAHPLRIHITYPARMSRSTTFFRPLILFPHFFYCLGYSAVFAVEHFLHFWTILFIGRMTAWQRAQTERYFIYMSRLAAYGMLLVDEYPPFNGAQPRAAATVFLETEFSHGLDDDMHAASKYAANATAPEKEDIGE